MLEIGTKAPEFNLKNQDNEDVRLSDFLGKKVILYFYPKDMTSGCTVEACSYRDYYPDFKLKDAVVIGVSKDSVSSHKKFKDKYNLPFILLSDESLDTLIKYDVWKEKSMYGKKYMGIIRSTYLIDENGIIEKAYSKVNPSTNAKEMLELL